MPHEPPNLYLDHSVIAHELWWPQIDAAVSSGEARLAVSVWNLIEIGSATDRKHQARRLEFLERNNPLWIVERVAVQRQEVRRFLWISRFGAPPDELGVFTPHLSVVDGFLSGPKVRVGLTARTFIDGTDFARIEELKNAGAGCFAATASSRSQDVQEAPRRGLQGLDQEPHPGH